MGDPGPSSGRKSFMSLRQLRSPPPINIGIALHWASYFKFLKYNVRFFSTYTARVCRGSPFNERRGTVLAYGLSCVMTTSSDI